MSHMVSSIARCAYCHDSPQGRLRGCPRCQTQLHAECWVEARSCPTLGCPWLAAAARSDPEYEVRWRDEWPLHLLRYFVRGLAGVAVLLVLLWSGRALQPLLAEPTLEVRNRSGVVLSEVRLNTVHPDRTPTAVARKLGDCESLKLWAPHDYGPDKAELEAFVDGRRVELACLLPRWTGRRITVDIAPDLTLLLRDDSHR